MNLRRRFALIVRWGILSFIVVALIMSATALISGEALSYPTLLNASISRWWDLLFAPIAVSLMVAIGTTSTVLEVYREHGRKMYWYQEDLSDFFVFSIVSTSVFLAPIGIGIVEGSIFSVIWELAIVPAFYFLLGLKYCFQRGSNLILQATLWPRIGRWITASDHRDYQ